MPKFDLLLTDNITSVNSSDIPVGQPIVLLYFKTNCGYCDKETREIVNEMDALKNVKFYFITPEISAKAKQYKEKYGLDKYKNIVVASDINKLFEKHYKPTGTPMIIVFDKHKQLRGVFSGSPDINTLINAVQTL